MRVERGREEKEEGAKENQNAKTVFFHGNFKLCGSSSVNCSETLKFILKS